MTLVRRRTPPYDRSRRLVYKPLSEPERATECRVALPPALVAAAECEQRLGDAGDLTPENWSI